MESALNDTKQMAPFIVKGELGTEGFKILYIVFHHITMWFLPFLKCVHINMLVLLVVCMHIY